MRNLIPHIIQEQYQQGHFEGNFDALTMFVDVSGFTPMTQILMKHGHEGAEILATVMNDIFDALINTVHARGGFVSTFAGDAFTAIFPFNNEVIPTDDLILHALACVKTFQLLFHQYGIQTTSQGEFPLQFRVGLSGGKVEWGIVGDTDKAYFFRGEAIDGCSASEHQAQKGEVIFDNTVAQQLRKVPGASESARHIRSLQVDRLEGGYYRLRKLPESLPEEFALPELPDTPGLDPDILARFFPTTLIHLAAMGEFRHVVSIFISFDGIATVHELNDWVCLLLDHINTFGGYFNRISFGDKGGFILCGFGAPVTYENTINRALSFILSVKDDIKRVETLSALKFRAGITYGMAYAGIAGGEKRCEYTYHGEVVNLAARFMMKADWGEIFVSDAVRDNTMQFNFAHKGNFVYKGIADPVSTSVLISRKPGIRHQPFTEAMIGRREELQRLQQFAAPIFKHTFAGIVCIYGEAGIGKSRLAYALQEAMQKQHPVHWFNCPADQIVHKPFNPFITCFMRYFEQGQEHTEAENKATFKEKYDMLMGALGSHPEDLHLQSPSQRARGEVWSELLRIYSVIGALVGLSWKDSLWEQLDAKGKYDNTVAAIKTFFLAQSLFLPTVIELEDGHWLDSDSLVVLQALTRHVSQYPLLLLSTVRYSEYGSKPCLFNPQDFTERNIPHEQIELREFSDTDLRNFAKVHLGGPMAEEFYGVLSEKTNGNPFFVEQLLHYFIENELVERTDGCWQLKAGDVPLPDTLNAVLIARIDRLTDEVKEVVKTAAVIGREFDVLLLSKMLKREIRALLSEVKLVEKSRIWQVLQEWLYVFNHALLRDIAYQMQLKAHLRELHQLAAETMEKLYAPHLTRWYADLAFHYEKAESTEKAIEYLEKAGDDAKAQYHNQQALTLYDRLLSHLHEMFGFTEIEVDTLLKKAEILELIGEWKTCQQICEEALKLSEQIGNIRRKGQAILLLGTLSRQRGEYDQAMAYFDQALELFETMKDRQGIGEVFKGKGVVYRRQGDDDAAIACYEQAIAIHEERGDRLRIAMNADNMGVVYQEVRGDYETAMGWFQKSLQIFEALEETLEMPKALNNIGECHRLQGHYDAAMEYYQQALQIAEELGHKLEIAIDLGNIGHVYQAQGDPDRAIASYDQAITIAKELESKYYLAEYLLGKADVLFSLQRYSEARVITAEGFWIAKEINRKECILQGNVLSAKVDFALGFENAPRRLVDLLQQINNDAEIAALHYELWKMVPNEDHRQTALKLYQTLYQHTPNIEYKIRIEEMQT